MHKFTQIVLDTGEYTLYLDDLFIESQDYDIKLDLNDTALATVRTLRIELDVIDEAKEE